MVSYKRYNAYDGLMNHILNKFTKGIMQGIEDATIQLFRRNGFNVSDNPNLEEMYILNKELQSLGYSLQIKSIDDSIKRYSLIKCNQEPFVEMDWFEVHTIINYENYNMEIIIKQKERD